MGNRPPREIYFKNPVYVQWALVDRITDDDGIYLTDESVSRPVYGVSLEKHLDVSSRKIATVIGKCVQTLLRHGINEEVGTSTNRTLFVQKYKLAKP